MAVSTTTSSTLLAKLEQINWCYSISTTLLGVDTNLLVKFIVEENAYAIMLTDFSSTYFECLIGNKIEESFNRYNNKSRRLTYQQILQYIAELLQDLKATNNLSFEKIETDCHTTRINVKASKMFNKQKFDWRFYIISTEPQIFLKHFSLPVWRGLMHYYQLNQLSQDSFLNDQMNPQDNNAHNNHVNEDFNLVPLMIEDSKLKDVFR
mgnify:CR=1 FL=1